VEFAMKVHFSVLAAMVVLASSAAAGAQSITADGTNSETSAPHQQNMTVAQGWVPPDGGVTADKTRRQINAELVQAQRDGQLTYLDRTLYAHH
jgi:hypothetical protein